MKKEFYDITVAGLKRQLPVAPVSDELSIAALIIFGDVELTVAAAGALNKIAPEHDILITAEAKSIPLIHEMARQNGESTYLVARKGMKVYMRDAFSVEVVSITTKAKQMLYLDRSDMELMKGKRVVIVDDVISTGESLRAVEKLVRASGGKIVGKLAILAEGDAKFRNDIQFLGHIPLLNPDGSAKE